MRRGDVLAKGDTSPDMDMTYRNFIIIDLILRGKKASESEANDRNGERKVLRLEKGIDILETRT